MEAYDVHLATIVLTIAFMLDLSIRNDQRKQIEYELGSIRFYSDAIV